MATASSNESAINTSYFDHFTCNICLEVLREPVQCVRNEHYFCKPCITQHLTCSQTCPVCSDDLTTATLRPSPRVVANLLQQFQSTRCTYANRGCSASVRHEVLLSHHEEYGFAPVRCSNDGCEETVDRQDLPSHERERCDFRPVTCEECHDRMNQKEYGRHPCLLLKEIDKNKLGLVEVENILREVQEEQRLQGEQIQRILSREMARPSSTGGQHGKEERRQTKQESPIKETIGSSGRLGEETNKQARQTIQPNAPRRQQDTDMTQQVIKPGQSSSTSKQRKKTNERQLKKSTVSKLTKIFVAGGGNRSYEVFDWSTQQWTLYENTLFFDHNNGFSFVYDNKVMICGGTNTNRVEVVGMTKPRSSNAFPMLLPSTNCGKGVLSGEKILTFGESVSATHLTPPYESEVQMHYRYALGDITLSSYGVACVNENAVAIVGGYKKNRNSSFRELTDDVLLYNPTTNQLKKLAPLPYKVANMAVLAYSDNVIILGGQTRLALNDVIMYNITSQQCFKLPKMLKARTRCAAVIMGDIIVAIGGSSLTSSYKTAEYLVRGEKIWKELPEMHGYRNGATACALP